MVVATKSLDKLQHLLLLRDVVHYIQIIKAILAFYLFKRILQSENGKTNPAYQHALQESFGHTKVVLPKQIRTGKNTCIKWILYC